jgi:hypothetical protein
MHHTFLRHYLLMILRLREITCCSINKLWFLCSSIVFTNFPIPHKPWMFLTELESRKHGSYFMCFCYSTFKSSLFLKHWTNDTFPRCLNVSKLHVHGPCLRVSCHSQIDWQLFLLKKHLTIAHCNGETVSFLYSRNGILSVI